MSHVVGKNRKELLAMAKGHGDGKKGIVIGVRYFLSRQSFIAVKHVSISFKLAFLVSAALLCFYFYVH